MGTIFGATILIAAVFCLLAAMQMHGWLNPRRPIMNEEHKRLNRKIYLQAYGISLIFFIIGYLLLR